VTFNFHHVPESDGALKKVVRDKIRHFFQIYLDRPDPIAFMSITVDTSDRVYDDFNRLLFLARSSVCALGNEIPEESDQFRFLHTTCLLNREGSVGLFLGKQTVMRISIPLDLSSRSFIPSLCFIRSRRPIPLLVPSLVPFPTCSV
jgi:hypothetical protein